ncbi:MAG: hypothetical protein M1812_000158 [Candelaria pacifica]|nr:MAG: hypothetical protein M1812_000158 [Candelaria pacifica]
MATQTGQNASEPVIFTPAERIKQLIEVDRDVVNLLRSAGSAVKALTNEGALSTETFEQPAGIETHKAKFRASAADYFALLSSIDVRLRRQIYALEEADIISTETPKDSQTSLAVPAAFAALGGGAASATPSQTASEKATSAVGGLGSLDVGWLNSRSDTVGKEMEAEIWEKAKNFLQIMQDAPVEHVSTAHEKRVADTMEIEHHQS